ncbi:type II toxin-antitoxin system HicA family toxin [Photorhabdus antumapuensis]|uniref:type II toxin-antitoxin system HicA family toxin n=1 Tax=Photorhabdus antumapuensis TaxID=2862867 RepID=UPI001CEC6B88|nr:type II toxin-antitoxin system HicA family toxin [Photorhabdus antumapuensis]
MKSTDLIKELISVGCELRRLRKESPITGKILPVLYPKKDLPIDTAKSVILWRSSCFSQ